MDEERTVGQVVDEIVVALRADADPTRADQERAYLKSSIDHWGVRVPATRAIVKRALPRRPAPSHGLVTGVAEALWTEPVHERRLAACHVLELHHAVLDAGDLPLLERLIRESRTWALVDVLAPNVVGPMQERDPAGIGPTLDAWNADDDVWVRRASLLALLVPLRSGAGDWDRFTRYADACWEETEFFIRKALGWILRDTAKRRPDLVCDWLLPRAATASGVTIREAIKPLTDEQRAAILTARGS